MKIHQRQRDQQIDAAVSQLQGLGGDEEGGAAFRNIGDMVKAQRDFPMILRNTLAGLQEGRAPGAIVENDEVVAALEKGLEHLDLPPTVLKSLRDTLQSGVTRQGGKDVFFYGLTEGNVRRGW